MSDESPPKQSNYRIRHRTLYKYSEPVAICQNQVRMMPRSMATRVFRVDSHYVQAKISPEPDHYHEHHDYFENRVLSFSIESPHRELEVELSSEVTVSEIEKVAELESPPWQQVADAVAERFDRDWLATQEFLFDSPRIRRADQFAEYALSSFKADRPIVEAAIDLTNRIHTDFAYDTATTDVGTSTEKAFEQRSGVCQDFAHVAIACLRSIGLPARYVSGYLRTHPPEGEDKLEGADESHAWLGLYAGDEVGWIDLDPTNDRPMDTNHIPICLGRDYDDVSPMRGVVLGGGKTTLNVQVDVEPMIEAP